MKYAIPIPRSVALANQIHIIFMSAEQKIDCHREMKGKKAQNAFNIHFLNYRRNDFFGSTKLEACMLVCYFSMFLFTL